MSVVHDPYEDVNMSSVADPNGTGNPPKWEGHHHARTDAPIDTKHGVADYLSGDGTDSEGNYVTEPYTIFSNTSSGGQSWWPWDDPPYDDSRAPESLRDGNGVIAVPGYEMHFGTHTYAFFSTASEHDVRRESGIPEKHQDVIDERRDAESTPDAVVGFAHVGRYLSSEITDREYERYRFNVERMAGQGVPTLLGTGRDVGWPHTRNIDLWDRLLADFAPDYLPWKTAHNDPYSPGVVGDDLDRRWVSVLIDASDFDPSDQTASRQAARDRMAQGATLVHMRESFDSDGDVPEPPMPTDVGVDGDTIYAESDADTTEWITAGGETAGTGESVDASEGDRYLRAELWNNDESALTLTQPWGTAILTV